MSAQKKFDTERKGEEPLFYEEVDEVSVPKVETLAERMRRNKNKK
jgi:hypothetical protein